MKTFAEPHNEQSGAVAVLMAIAIMTLLVVAAVCINTGWLYLVKSQAQRAVDAAALAAATGLPTYTRGGGDQTTVEKLLQIFNGTNSSDASNLVMGTDPAFGLNNVAYVRYQDNQVQPEGELRKVNGVTITKQYNVHHFIAGVLGSLSTDIQVSATAVVGGVSCATPRLPIGIMDCEFSSPGSNVCNMGCDSEAAVEFSNANEDTGFFFSYDPTLPPSADNCRDWARGNPLIPELCSGSVIGMNNGEVNSCLEKIEDIFYGTRGETPPCIDPNPPNNPIPCGPNNPWEMFVPIVSCSDIESGNPNQDAPVSGFAKIAVTEVVRQGNIGRISFRFLCDTVQGELGGGQDCGLSATVPILVK